jgi:hypothetical protein
MIYCWQNVGIGVNIAQLDGSNRARIIQSFSMPWPLKDLEEALSLCSMIVRGRKSIIMISWQGCYGMSIKLVWADQKELTLM